MPTDQFEPRIAVREEKRQANEALGRSFCKTLAELITNADSSSKRKHHISQSTGLVDLMLKVSKGNHLDTAELKRQLQGKSPLRRLIVEVATSKGHGRKPREIAVIDEAEGMSAQVLRTALEDIGGDRKELTGGAVGRNLFGRGLSDVMRAHHDSAVQTFDGNELTIAKGEWPPGGRWTIKRKFVERPRAKDFANTLLNPALPGTAVVFSADKRCRIPDPQYISRRLANFYMLRLIAADPQLSLVLRQYRAAGVQVDPVTYDFPVGQVIESFSRTFRVDATESLPVDVLIVRSDQKLEGVSPDRDGRENGLLIVDELDAVYDLTFVDPDYERAEFLKHIFGVIRITGLRAVLERYLNSPDFPTSPLRVDRDGFNREHEFSRVLLEFLATELRPCYERERKRIEERGQGQFSSETQRRIEDALKNLNRFFQNITDLTGSGAGGNGNTPPAPQKGTAWNQHGTIEATARSTAGPVRAETRVKIEEVNPNDSGFFKRVDYDELDGKKPSQFAAGVITVNTSDPLNRLVFGTGASKEAAKKEFDRRLIADAKAQQRLASILLDEACFRALQQLFDDNKLPLPQNREIDKIHEQIDQYKFESATNVYRALVR
jgi:hypothetical protein